MLEPQLSNAIVRGSHTHTHQSQHVFKPNQQYKNLNVNETTKQTIFAIRT